MRRQCTYLAALKFDKPITASAKARITCTADCTLCSQDVTSFGIGYVFDSDIESILELNVVYRDTAKLQLIC
jgi:hypothetical protein